MLQIALDQTEKRIDAQMTLRLTTEARATRLFGTCMACTVLVVGTFIYAASKESASYIITTSAITSLQLFSAAMCAFCAAIPREGRLPGRLPSDIWHNITDLNTTLDQFLKSLLDENRQHIIENDKHQTALEKAISIACITAVSTPLTSLIVFYTLKFL